LAAARIGDQMTERDRIQIGQIQEMARRVAAGRGFSERAHAAAIFLPASKDRAVWDNNSTAVRTCASSMMSGGNSRTTLSPAPMTRRPWARAAATKSVLGTRIL